MFIKLYKVNKRAKDYYLSVIHLNTSQIVYMSEDTDMKKMFVEGKLNIKLHKEAAFTKLRLATKSGVEEITVVDTPATIESKIMTLDTRQLLRD